MKTKKEHTAFPPVRGFDSELLKKVNEKRVNNGHTWKFLITKWFVRYLNSGKGAQIGKQ